MGYQVLLFNQIHTVAGGRQVCFIYSLRVGPVSQRTSMPPRTTTQWHVAKPTVPFTNSSRALVAKTILIDSNMPFLTCCLLLLLLHTRFTECYLLASLFRVLLHACLHPFASFSCLLFHLGLVLEQLLDSVWVWDMAAFFDAWTLGPVLRRFVVSTLLVFF